MMVICLLHSMQFKKVMESNPKQPSCKKSVWPEKGYYEKWCEIQSGGQEMPVMLG